MAGIAWGNNLNDPVRRTCTATVCQFIRITDDAQIRFYNGILVFGKLHSKRGRVDTAGNVFGSEIAVDICVQFAQHGLVMPDHKYGR